MVIDEKAVFLAALALPDATEREAYLLEACAGEPDVLGHVRELLSAHEESLGPLDRRPAPLGVTVDAAHLETPGAVIGSYKLLEPIGEGGMGRVWMAQQTEPVKRLVAVKLIKAGMDSKQVIARFEAERQALALMEHPNIARVLDGGTTRAGRPYFVMDLVKGVPITRYCDEHHLTPRQRLELFMPVCQAVQHAHQKAVIHRDIKPSNVLVAVYDSKPVPKVIDFGVAKAAGQSLTDKTLVTGFGNIVGTLEYMSPEQAEVNQLDIDTRSDIYSLGVLLYELLTGSTPFTRKDLEKAGMLEMLRVIREQEPSKPSTKLSSSDALPTLSANRGTEPAKLTKLLRGDLDWIVMKALEKDRSRRYETANGFAMDVQRYLADEAVLACPPSAGYRLRKLVRRNMRPVLAGLLVLVVLVAGIIGTTWQAIRATSERDRASAAEGEARTAQAMEAGLRVEADRARSDAEAEARRANVVLDLIVQMLSKANAYDELGKPETYTVYQMMLDFSRALPQELDTQPAVKAEIHAILAKGFTNLDSDRAEAHIREALRFRRSALGEDHPHYAESLLTHATFLWICSGQYAESEQLCRQALSILRKHPKEVNLRLRAYRWLGANLLLQHKHVAVDEFTREAMEFAGQNGVQNNHWIATMLMDTANSQMDRGQPDAAEPIAKEALRMNRALGPNRMETANCAAWPLAAIQSRLKKHAEAEQSYREAARIFAHHRAYGLVGKEVYGGLRGAMEAQGKAVEFQKLVNNPLDVGAVAYWYYSAINGIRDGDVKEYQRVCRLLVERCSNSAHPMALEFVTSACIVHPQALDDWAPAVLLARRFVSIDPEASWNWTTLGVLLFRAGKAGEALKTLSHAESLPQEPEGNEFYGQSRKIVRWFYLALAHHRTGNEVPARKWFAQAEAALEHLGSEKGLEHRFSFSRDTQLHFANLRSESQQLFRPKGTQAK